MEEKGETIVRLGIMKPAYKGVYYSLDYAM
jgi:hypothetical protein